jgi:threonine dehydrogenase-like Zn-dependent dehydrogenase
VAHRPGRVSDLQQADLPEIDVREGVADERVETRLVDLHVEDRAAAAHRFKLSEAIEAYDVFGAAAETNALKVVLEGEKAPLNAAKREALALA